MAHHLVLSVAIVAVALIAPRAAGYPWQVCGTTGNFTVKSKYLANLDLIAATLPSNASASPDLFATAEDVGAIPEQVSALGLCRGDANATTCLGCLVQAFRDLPNLCAYNKDATIYYDWCLLQYSNIHFLSADDSGPTMTYMVGYNVNVRSELARFNRVVAMLVNATADYAAYNSTRRYASGEADFNQEVPKVYSWAQCTPDLTPARCRDCLARSITQNIGLFTNRLGARALRVRCSFRYETAPFIDGPVMVHLPGPSASSGAPAQAPAAMVPTVNVTPAAAARAERMGYRTNKVLAIVVPTIAAILATIVACFYSWRRILKPAAKPLQQCSTRPDDILSIDSLLLNLSILRVATDDFAEHKRLGEGGFGVVYKGVLPEGQEVAVKRLSQTSRQGIEELKTELVLVAKLNHKNLVRLIGVCLEAQEKILVYEYMPNRSLDTILFDTTKRKELDWGKRFKVINGIARGLQYLQEDSHLKIVHRDLKASNVLLDSVYNPKISDFGLAKIFGGDQSQIVTHRIAGTYGYMSPEYAMRGQYSVKSDVFSFGVLVLEIVTGRKNSGTYNSEQDVDLINLTWDHWTKEKAIELIDPSLSSHCPTDQLLKCIHIGLLCVQQKPADRPLMSAVNVMLSSNTVRLPSLSRPAFCTQEIGANSDVNLEQNLTASQWPGNSRKVSSNEVSITEIEPR